MKKFFCIFLLVIGLVTVIFAKDISSNATNQKQNFRICFERVSEQIKSKNGNIIAEIHFDKPKVFGEFDGVDVINTYFDKACNDFFYGNEEENDNLMERFKESVERMKLGYGEATLEVSPLEYRVDTQATFINTQKHIDAKIISIKETLFWNAGGIQSYDYFGNTFYLDTGEKVSLDYFVKKMNSDIFYKEVLALLHKDFLEFKEDEFEKDYGDYTLKDYNFFYDGRDIFVVFNQLVDNSSYIIKFNPYSSDLNNAIVY